MAHHDHRHVPALGHAHQKIDGGPPGAARGGQKRTPDQRRALGDRLGRGPLGIGIGRDDEATGLPHDDRRDARPVPRRILAPLLERGIGQRTGQADGIGIVIEVDAPTATREIPGVERHASRAGGGGLLDRGHASEGRARHRQFYAPRCATSDP